MALTQFASVGTLLRERLTVLAPTNVSNGAGGTTTTFAERGIVNGAIYMPARNSDMEAIVGGQREDKEIVEMILDASSVAIGGDCRVQDARGRVFELIRLGRQEQLVIAYGRRVA